MTQIQKVGTIRNRLKIALAEKETRDGKRYTYRELQTLTGVSTSTLTDWARGHVKHISIDALAAMCAFLECTPADLLEYIPTKPAE